jgi:putative hydrolase of the HAD superfamily
VDGSNVELFPDTVPALEQLKDKGIVLGILSDAWPSLENKYSRLGIKQYFKSFTISARVGCYKPNDLMYRTAVADIGIEPHKLLFVDNDLESVQAAIKLGMDGVVMARDSRDMILERLGTCTTCRNLLRR